MHNVISKKAIKARCLRIPGCCRWLRVAAVAVAWAWVVPYAAPAVAAPAKSVGKAAADDAGWSALGDRIRACMGREDPACLLAAHEDLKKVAPMGSVSLPFVAGVAAFLAGRHAQAKTELTQVAGNPTAPRELREQAESWIELSDATVAVLQGAKAYPLAGGKVVAWVRPGPDEVLVGYLDRVIAKALPKLEAAFGPATGVIALHVYSQAAELARTSGLTEAQIRTSGTIALCKYNRVMLTSPQDLVFGYPWADTAVHELVHWFIIKRGGADVPIWLHEGLARGLQGLWRGANPEALDRDERHIAAWSRKQKKFIPFARMHPTMAALPSQRDTQLAFAEVHHAVAWLLQRAAARQGRAVDAGAGAGQLVALFAQGMDTTQALQAAVGLGLPAFEAAWKQQWARLDVGDTSAGPPGRPLLVFRRGNDPGDLRPLPPATRRHAELGDRFAVLKRPLAAAIEYRKAIAAGPQEGPLLVARLVRVLLDLGKTAEAAEYLVPALDQYPEHAPLHVLAGRAAIARSQWKTAIEALEQAAWLNPYDPQLHALAAQAHTSAGQQGEAAAARGRQALVEAAGL